MTDLERHLNELGVIARPAKTELETELEAELETELRPDGPPHTWRGVWYADGNIPH